MEIDVGTLNLIEKCDDSDFRKKVGEKKKKNFGEMRRRKSEKFVFKETGQAEEMNIF